MIEKSAHRAGTLPERPRGTHEEPRGDPAAEAECVPAPSVSQALRQRDLCPTSR